MIKNFFIILYERKKEVIQKTMIDDYTQVKIEVIGYISGTRHVIYR
jgi:hypothetical protein